jgi:hypothetical protein
MRPFCNSLQRKPLSEQTLRHSAPSIVARINPKFELHGVRQSELCTQPEESIHSETNHKIDQAAPIQKKSLVSKRLRKVRNQRKIVDRIAQENGHGIFNPSSKRNSQKFAFHKHRVACRQLINKYRVARASRWEVEKVQPRAELANLSVDRAFALAASSSRFLGDEFVCSERRSRPEISAISSTAL